MKLINQQQVGELETILESLDDMVYASPDVMDACYHKFMCRCEKCLAWWVVVGPEITSMGLDFGPFTKSEFINGGGVVPIFVELEKTV